MIETPIPKLRDEPWGWKDEINDEAELDREWQRYEVGLLNRRHCGELTAADEEYERVRWIRSYFVRRHLEDFRRLTRAGLHFFLELTRADGQRLLGEAASLPPLMGHMRPHSLVTFGPVDLPDPAPLDLDDYGQQVGGQHVLGARLLWWCAAAASPVSFGYPARFSQRFWGQPIWCVERSRTVEANPRPVALLVAAATKVSQWLIRGSESRVPQLDVPSLHAQGPEEPIYFWWNGKRAELQKRPWQLLEHVWKSRGRKAAVEDVIDAVWDRHVEQSTWDRTVNRANHGLEEAQLPVSLHTKQGYLILDIVEM